MTGTGFIATDARLGNIVKMELLTPFVGEEGMTIVKIVVKKLILAKKAK